MKDGLECERYSNPVKDPVSSRYKNVSLEHVVFKDFTKSARTDLKKKWGT